ncbi:Uncharacterised protein [Vibrio cholerae]|uniref:Uncharacterized protein n=1 Tax=Vibrio cholerae TaxID=666 RepID=A0A655Y8D6_VIBCL|nr:Uncharacterised protein [Vibrio cholerae]
MPCRVHQIGSPHSVGGKKLQWPQWFFPLNHRIAVNQRHFCPSVRVWLFYASVDCVAAKVAQSLANERGRHAITQ